MSLTAAQRTLIDEIRALPPDERRRLWVADPVPRADRPLTVRELDVLALVADGRTNAVIGRLLGISEETVKSHLKHLAEKLDARNRAHIVARGFQAGHLARAGLPSG